MIGTRERFRRALLHWVHTHTTGETIAVTLTLRPEVGSCRISEAVAYSTLKLFLIRVNEQAFGKQAKRGRRLNCIVAKEGRAGSWRHLHFHLQLGVPSGISAAQWAADCEGLWRRMRWAGEQNDFGPVFSDGWLPYLLKLAGKADYLDSMLFELWYVPARR